ncbi:bifunctional [glutamine synthetase] adenylyltransferase/[glutamine synthetase]-adenylyl-L-tyrosine phosphorylase [Microbacterium excoecariae]|uniref:bifunctional [glutamine synthetase] adenylyltransferase/[glutamine synthetase]-adenylyl-L-tyrosine phosphorylase n=1 Tax=Microbacterium excoecariae TaxID=2715210 RepID=UPI00140B879E|nr:bifunctional [glutamine synthetase] adenylyltransferase/[glutamine synthetase]-adenylyl-L-tyrosine phosphorylase [Microbacterium excoecariae]
MTPLARASRRSVLARAGFADLSGSSDALDELAALTHADRDALIAGAARAADPDAAVRGILQVARRDAAPVAEMLAEARPAAHLWRVTGASQGLAEFLLRHPDAVRELRDAGSRLPTRDEMTSDLRAAVGWDDHVASRDGEEAWVALRVAYRRALLRIAAYDLAAPDPVEVVAEVSAALADAAGAALDAALAVARARVSEGVGARGLFPAGEVAQTRLAIIGMGKAGARELNYVSDVDVIFVAGVADDASLSESRAIDIATRLAVQTMRGISSFETEPPLWEVDANLRPEGKQGALVRTLDSHLAYYGRWAHSWEFQALLKARPLAGDPALARAYVEAVAPLVWASSSRDGFVGSVQAMRQRVSDNIAPGEVDRQLKLGPGGLRDIEFTVQLLQLVHGASDSSVRAGGTLAALDQLVDGGYIGRADAAAFATDYRILRVLEHRLQLQQLRRTHLMPEGDEHLRVLARATAFYDPAAGVAGGTAVDVRATWERVRSEVRDIHVRLFYRPLLSAVAATEYDARALTGTEAHDRLAAIGFRDAGSALRHIAALTRGVSRKATVQRTLMPVMLRWFAEGVDPDYGLVAFRRVSERLGTSPWFLRMLRDSSGAAESLTTLLSGSRYVGELMEWIPESVAWLDGGEQLRPRAYEVLDQEARAIQSRRTSFDDAMRAVRGIRRRELLRTAMGSMTGDLTIKDVTTALTTITDVALQATLRAVRREVVPEEHQHFEFSIIGMGRYGGAEVGFGSDADVLFVYRAPDIDPQVADRYARKIVSTLRDAAEDHRVPLELDADLRPEGRNGPIVRTLDAYRAYYARWSVSWEAQALLRARAVAGTRALCADFMAMVDAVRYPAQVRPEDVREIKRIKARVENERMPKGVDPSRHLKLGPGGLSDVEWLVQLIQLEHGHRVEGLRTPRTLHALQAAYDAGLLAEEHAQQLGASWRLATRLRSAHTLLTGATSDALPTDYGELDGIGRILEYPPGSGPLVEETWLRTARRARRTYERVFYDL